METQAPRSERIAVMATVEEKRAVRFVADARGLTESDVMRDMTMDEIVSESERMRAALATLPRSA